MRKKLFILVAVLCLLPVWLRAQNDDFTVHIVKWYEDIGSIARKYGVSTETIMEYNGLTSPKLSRRQQLKIPKHPGQVVQAPAAAAAEEAEAAGVEEEPQSLLRQLLDRLFDRRSDRVKATLLLPFQNRGSISTTNYDFYSGLLMAIKDLSDEGVQTDLRVYDMSDGRNPVPDDILAESDFILGPISTRDITTVLEDCPSGKYIISPLDSRVSALADSLSGIIQGPTPADAQLRDLIDWIREERRPGDRLLLFTEKNATPTVLARYLAESGLEYATITYGILEGRSIEGRITAQMDKEHVNRALIASDNEAFVNDVVRNLNLMTFMQYEVELYAPSRIRNFETIEVESFHKTHLHLSSSYYIDYDDPKVMRFLLSYRALYNTEPTQYAFLGYDTARYFIGSLVNGGYGWAGRLTRDRYRGLQSDFQFRQSGHGSFLNQAVRRAVYHPDYTIQLLK